MDVVGDEAYTIMHIVPTNIIDVPGSANNHYINSLLIKFFYFFAPNTGFVARLPTVLSFLVYLYFAYRIVSKFPHWMGVFCFFMLIANPFLLEFFSLARGYGLSLAFMMASLYYATENIRSYSISTLTKSLIWAGLSVLSIFSMIYFWIALAFVLNLVVLLKEQKKVFIKTILRSFWLGLALCCIITPLILKVIESEDLLYGGENNVFNDTISSLLSYSLGNVSMKAKYMGLLRMILVLLFIALNGIAVAVAYVRYRDKFSMKNIFLVLFVIICLLITVTYYIAEIRFPLGRNTLFLYPIFILFLSFCLLDLKQYLRIIIGSIIFVLLSYNLVINLSTYKTIHWPSESRTSIVLDEIFKDGLYEKKKNKVGFSGYFYNAYHYYCDYVGKDKYTNIEIPNVKPIERNCIIDSNTDYYVLYFKEHQYDDSVNPDNYFASLLMDRTNCKGIRTLSFPKENVFVYKIVCEE